MAIKIHLEHDLYHDRYTIMALGSELATWMDRLSCGLEMIGTELKRLNDRDGIDEDMAKKLDALRQLLGENDET